MTQKPSNFFQIQHAVNLEPTARWVRVKMDGETIADSKNALLFLDWNINFPTYFFPQRDINMDLLQSSVLSASLKENFLHWSVQSGDMIADNAAWGFSQPPQGMEALQDYITFRWEKPISWFVEEEEMFVHARDPHKRIDVLASSRHIEVKVEGETIADTRRPHLLFETFLPTRYYIPQEDVRMDLLQESTTTSGCAYKGFANYYSVKGKNQLVEDIVWTYPNPNPEYFKIEGLLCFYNEKVDIYVDGELESRPISPFS